MARKTCTSCGTSIANGEAVVRSINFEQVAWHPECYLTRELDEQLVSA